CGMINGFGMGEDLIHTIVMADDPMQVMLQTVGSPLKNGTELAIFDANREPLPAGEKGELGYRGPNMFLGYYKNPEKTDATRGEDGWFYTGDTGFVDEDGRLRLSGRKKEMINKGGSKIFPLTIENILCFHPKIETVAVIGLPDPDLGEKVCACVIAKPGQTVTHEDVKTYMEQQGASKYEMPDITQVLSEFPLTPTGKIKKDLLPEKIAKN
ncbi:MAG: long-chain fatty acid--CoA ligase, partial [Desulfatitalea sp.]|nr:fatty acid--CoA ligase family protein [Desulfatitalea sp.]NNK01524.1 long-chain fatty acid--CoA ligase [Desulfatitalea sp.]